MENGRIKWLSRGRGGNEKTVWPARLRLDLEAALRAALLRAGGDAAPRQRPLHERLAEALDAGRTWMVLEPGEFTFDVRPYVIREPSLRAVVIQNLAVLRGSPEPPFPRAPELTAEDVRPLYSVDHE